LLFIINDLLAAVNCEITTLSILSVIGI